MNRLRLVLIFLVCLAASVFAAIRMAYCILANPQRAWVIALSHDQLANAAANGNPDETISSRANRARREGVPWGCHLCAFLDWLDDNHCQRSDGV